MMMKKTTKGGVAMRFTIVWWWDPEERRWDWSVEPEVHGELRRLRREVEEEFWRLIGPAWNRDEEEWRQALDAALVELRARFPGHEFQEERDFKREEGWEDWLGLAFTVTQEMLSWENREREQA
jgi:hypothetical protein